MPKVREVTLPKSQHSKHQELRALLPHADPDSDYFKNRLLHFLLIQGFHHSMLNVYRDSATAPMRALSPPPHH